LSLALRAAVADCEQRPGNRIASPGGRIYIRSHRQTELHVFAEEDFLT